MGIVDLGRQSITLTNKGDEPVTAERPRIDGRDRNAFRVVSDNCSNQSLAPNGSCTVTIEFQEQTAGNFRAELTVGSSSGIDAEIKLRGTIPGHDDDVQIEPKPKNEPSQIG